MSELPVEFDMGGGGRSHDALVARLVSDLRPVHRLAPPWLRAAGWLAVVFAIAVALGSFADLDEMRERLLGATDMWLAVLGSTSTFVLAAIAAFQLSLPDRSRVWAVLPLPGLALWLGASGMGCARAILVPGTTEATIGEEMHCLAFIIGFSVPLSVVIVVMLRRGFTLCPSLTGAVAGLAVAAASATLLDFFHPFDAAFTDLAIHLIAVSLVVMANRFFAARTFGEDLSPVAA